MWGKILFVVLIAAGIATWVGRDPLTTADRARADEVPVLVATDPRKFSGEGILVAYESSSQSVYYLLYETTKHRFVRKELRFSEERGCTPQAGDLPCVLPESNPIPVAVGSHIRVEGLSDAQRILVTSIDIVPDSDRDFSLLTLDVGETGSSLDVDVRVSKVYAGGGCEIMLGCFDESIARVEFSVRTPEDQMTSTLVPGMLEDLPDGALLLLWADESLGRATFVVAHGKAR